MLIFCGEIDIHCHGSYGYSIYGVDDSLIKNANGNLAGSWCNLFVDVKRAISFGIPREDAYYMASTTPANYMGINKGRIEVCYDADFIVVTKNNELLKTVIGGKIFKE